MERVIFHCDLNSFYASVELLDHPELRHLPVAVCGDPKSRHGIILAKNEPAKAFGVKTAETIWQARQKCPELVLLPAHHDRYRAFSRKVNSLYREYTDLVEPFGIDESWLDVTGTLHLFGGDPAAIAGKMEELMGRRKDKQPYDMPSAGSVFKRPEGHFAGTLIEQAGLKGRSVGGAQVSPKHAGFIVNTGGATCQDVLDLIALIQKTVQEKFGVALEPEVRVTGEV